MRVIVEQATEGVATLTTSPHPPAELLRLVVADIVANGGSVIFPSLVRLFTAGATVMGPTLRRDPSSIIDPTDALPSSFARDLSPLGRESGASAGAFQRAMIRHLEACCRDAITLSASGVGVGGGGGGWLNRRGNTALNRAVSSLAAVSAAVAEAAAEGLLPGVETGHLAVGFLLSLLRQVTGASASVGSNSNGTGGGEGAKATVLGACHIATVVALRRAIQRDSGNGSRIGRKRGGSGVGREASEARLHSQELSTPRAGKSRLVMDEDGNDLLEECLLMIAHSFDTLLGEERRGSASGGGSISSIASIAASSPYHGPPAPPSMTRAVSPKPRSPVSSAMAAMVADSGGQEGSDRGDLAGKRQLIPPPLDLSGMGEPTADAPLTTAGMFADTPVAIPRWSSRFDFPGEVESTSMIADPSRLAMTFTAVELASIGSTGGGGGSIGQNRVPITHSALLSASSTGRSPTASASKSLWESAAAGAAGLVAAADRGSKGGGGGGIGGGNSGDGGLHGMRESLVHRLRGSSGRAFVAGFVAELRGLLLSDSDNVRKLATRLAGALLARRRTAVQELLGEELLSTGFSMLEHPLGGEASFDPVSEDEALAEETRAQAFALWLTGGGQEAALREGFDRAADRAYALVPHVSSAEGLVSALTRAELLASGGGSGGGGGGNDASSALSRLGSGVGGALGALAAAGPNRKTITVDRAIQRADMIGE